MSTSHIAIHFGRNSLFQCHHCGGTYDPKLPQPTEAFLALAEWFTDKHRVCKLTDRGLACSHCDQFGHAPDLCPRLHPSTPQEWLDGPDTGISSKAICHAHFGEAYGVNLDSPPRDADDFGRCYRFLKLFPKASAGLEDLSGRFTSWAALVSNWHALTALYEEELPSGRFTKLNARIKELAL